VHTLIVELVVNPGIGSAAGDEDPGRPALRKPGQRRPKRAYSPAP